MTGFKIIATGSCLPAKIVTNEDMSKLVETSDEWITKRTGIKERRHCVEETHFDLAREAAGQALSRAGIDRGKIGVCVVSTLGSEFVVPSCGCRLQAALGLPEDAACFDVNAACTGFLYGLRVAQGFLSAEKPYALVVGCEVLSRMTDFTDRSTCVLFGDGAGAVLLQASDDEPGLVLGSRGDAEILYTPGLLSQEPPYVHMQGTAVFKFAVDIVPKCIAQICAKTGTEWEDADWVVFHQANARIIDHVAKKLGIPEEKLPKIIHRYGNMSAACIPIVLDELYKAGNLRPGMKLLCVGFGGGLTWGGGLLTIGEIVK